MNQMSNLLFKTAGAQSNRNGSELGVLDQIVPSSGLGQGLAGVLNQLFYLGLVAAVALALAMVIRGGIQYMTTDSVDGKGGARLRIQAALGGLVLAFAAILILNTVNPSLTTLNLEFRQLRLSNGTGLGLDPDENTVSSGARPQEDAQATGSEKNWVEKDAEAWVNGLSNGTRSTDGRLVVSVYSATGDAVTDSNTADGRGNADNLLREGSVALSPDLIAQHKPQTGQEVFINGVSVGFYEDATAASYNGTPFRNTIDIYDQNGTLGSKDILKNVPAGQWNITFGEKRPQISNPS
jgi:hypothetical protein